MKTILLLTDFSDRADRAAELALVLAKANHTNLLLYHSVVLLETFMYAGDPRAELLQGVAEGDVKLAELTDRLKSLMPAGEVLITSRAGTGSVKDSVLNIVGEDDIWLVVMGSNINSDLHYQFSDSNIFSVISNSRCPVVLVP